jgi:FkbM family methyltransferase
MPRGGARAAIHGALPLCSASGPGAGAADRDRRDSLAAVAVDVTTRIRDALFPRRGNLTRISFDEDGRGFQAFVPDDELPGLSRELILQRVYDAVGEPPRGTVIDAGAHVGLWSLLASRTAERVIALEPNPINNQVLQLNRQLNRAENIECHAAALWIEDGTVAFQSSWHTTGGSVSSGGDRRVPARSLDSLIAEYGDIDVLKIDIEGAEFEVLPAAEQLERVGRIIGELHIGSAGQEEPVIRALEGAGYTVEVIPAPSLYGVGQLPRVIRNWSALEGQLRIKLALVALLLAPVRKPRRPPGSFDMPLFVAQRA